MNAIMLLKSDYLRIPHQYHLKELSKNDQKCPLWRCHDQIKDVHFSPPEVTVKYQIKC